MKVGMAVIAAGFGLTLAGSVQADPRLDEKVYDPYVRNHVFEVETRASLEEGGPLKGSATYVGEFEYGVSDNLSLAFVSKVAGGAGEPRRLRGAGLEAVYYLGQIPKIGVDVGVYGEYMAGLNGDPGGLEGKLLFAKQAGRMQALLNLIAERPLHVADEGFASYGYATSVTWRTVGNLKVGVEAFGDLGDDHGFLKRRQGAYVGPAVLWEVHPARSPLEVEFGLGWLKSVAADRSEADSQVRLTLEFERRF
jgi:hypothetical protein